MTGFQPTLEEHALLAQLYERDSAWTDGELLRFLPRHLLFLRAGLITQLSTRMGRMTLLTVPGMRLVYGTAEGTESPQRSLDRAYLRRCAEVRGYVPTNAATTRHLTRFIGNLPLREMLTDRGIALVGGHMTSGGISRNGLDNIARRLQSSALTHHFRIIIFTPHLVTGQKRAQTYREFLSLIPLVPGQQEGKNPRLLTSNFDPERVETTGNGPLITPHMARRLHERHPDLLPIGSIETLRRTRVERTEQFHADLSVDRAVSHTQLRRHYGLNDHDLRRVPYVETYIRPVHMQKGLAVRTQFYLANKKEVARADHDLMRLVSVGEMRRKLGIPADDHWELNARSARKLGEPDAICWSPDGPVAAEYDTGLSGMTTMLKKLDAFADRNFIEAVWGVPSARRQARLNDNMRGHLQRDVLLVEWWKDLPEW